MYMYIYIRGRLGEQDLFVPTNQSAPEPGLAARFPDGENHFPGHFCVPSVPLGHCDWWAVCGNDAEDREARVGERFGQFAVERRCVRASVPGPGVGGRSAQDRARFGHWRSIRRCVMILNG